MPKRVYHASDREEDTESISHQSAPKRTRKGNEDVETNELCQEIYDAIRAYKSEDGRILCENFIRLPSKRTHADYYTTIKQPIDLIRIQQKIRTDEYQTFEQFIDDIQLLFGNAKAFYKKNSNEWRDANDLSKYFQSRINDEHPNRKRLSKKNLDDSIEKKRRSTEPLTNGSTNDDSSSNHSIDPYYFEEFFTAVYNANFNDRPITEIFSYIPSRKLYPDYYLIVRNPIDLKIIAMKIHNREYSTLDEMESDLFLMIANAKKYNDPKSQIYKDASALKKLISTVRSELESAMKSSKNDRLRLHKRDVLLSSEIATMEYPEEPEDEDVLRIQQEQKRNEEADADSDTSSLGDEDDSFRILYNAVKSFKLGAQNLIDPFMKLPKKRFHQDYYEEIKKPISMSSIQNSIKKGRYGEMNELVDDLKLMFNNAMHYNQEGSLIYNSAKKLMDVALEKAHELGYHENQPRLKEARVSLPMITIKEEYLEPSLNLTSISPRGRPPKKILQYTEQNIQTLYNYIREYQEEDISLIEPFISLPSAEEYPDYYESIEHPIDMTMIKDKVEKGLYKREQDLVDDLKRMFRNAKTYNMDESDIFKTASRLERLLSEKHQALMIKKDKLIQNLLANRPVHANSTKKSLPSSTKPSNDKFTTLLQTIKTFRDSQGRILSHPFLTLPSKVDYPDYYEIIHRPIDLKRIESRQYSSITALANDLQLMFDNACLYNEPGSTIYRDALTLQSVLISERNKLTKADLNVNNVQNLVQDLIWKLFIQTFNAQNSEGRFYTDSFTELSEQVSNEPFDVVYTFDLIKQNLNQRRYRRLDVFQDDLFKVFQRLRQLSDTQSQVYQDAIDLHNFYMHLRDDLCTHGNLLRSPALLYNKTHLEQELLREAKETVSPSHPNSTSPANPTKQASTSSIKGQTFYIGDFVYIDPIDDKHEPGIICIESFEHRNHEDYLIAYQFCRPEETYHLPTKKFLRQEVFLTENLAHVPLNQIQGLCHVLHSKDYYRYQPPLESDRDVYVCESRYNTKTKIVKKIKWWNLPENKRVKLLPRETPLEPIREVLKMGDSKVIEQESEAMDIIERSKETIPYDSVINEKLNENLREKRQFYEQIVLTKNSFFKIGDYVYANEKNQRLILHIEQIWKENDSYRLSGAAFLRFTAIPKRDQLLITTKSSFTRELFKCEGGNPIISTEQIEGKCSVLSLAHYATCRLTEVEESDVYICESKYVVDEHSLRALTKSLKRASLSSKAFADEIWTFRQELLLQQAAAPCHFSRATEQNCRRRLPSVRRRCFGKVSILEIKPKESPGGPFKLIEDGSSMDVDDQASNIDGDEQQSNHLNAEPASSATTSSLSSPTVPNRNNSNRKNNRRSSTARAPCGYLVFASESRKRLIKDNPGIPFGEMSRMIGDQWRRLTASERDKYEEKARERAREQEVNSAPPTQLTTNSSSTSTTPTSETHPMPVINPQRVVNGTVAINGHYQTNPPIQNVHQINGNLHPLGKPPTAAIVTCPPRTQRLVHSEAYLRYIENLKPDNQFISDWPKQLKASMSNTSNGANSSRTLPSNWLLNGSPGLYNNVHEALWSMRDNMWSDVIRIRNVLSEEW